MEGTFHTLINTKYMIYIFIYIYIYIYIYSIVEDVEGIAIPMFFLSDRFEKFLGEEG